MLLISAPTVVLPHDLLTPGCVAISNKRIIDVVPGDSYEGRKADITLPDGILAPGLIDLQLNGFSGVDLAQADLTGWEFVSARLLSTGVTSFLGTIISAPIDNIVNTIRKAAAHISSLSTSRARPLGIHLEGPFLSPRWRGAHHARWLCNPTPEALDNLIPFIPEIVKIVTLAPELPGGLQAVRRIASAGAVVSIGHTDADEETFGAAIDEGARMVTHVFNAQRPMLHREPGIAGRALVDSRVTCSLIGDLLHIDGTICRIAFKAAGGRIALITDAVAAAGMPPGEYVLGREPITVGEDGLPVRDDGTIAGSTLQLNHAVANMLSEDVDLVSAVNAASRIPAQILSRPDLGRIAPGAVADLVWLESRTLNVKATWVEAVLLHAT